MTRTVSQFITTRLLSTRASAALATTVVWAAALALAGISVQVWAGRIAPTHDVLSLLPGVPYAPLVLVLPLLKAVIRGAGIAGIPPESCILLALFGGAAALAGYWGTAIWLSWACSWHRSPRAFLTLAGFLLVSAPSWLIVAAFFASF